MYTIYAAFLYVQSGTETLLQIFKWKLFGFFYGQSSWKFACKYLWHLTLHIWSQKTRREMATLTFRHFASPDRSYRRAHWLTVLSYTNKGKKDDKRFLLSLQSRQLTLRLDIKLQQRGVCATRVCESAAADQLGVALVAFPLLPSFLLYYSRQLY